MKKYISVFAIMLMIFLAACSNQNISSAPTSNESNTQSNSVTKLEEGVWPANEYTDRCVLWSNTQHSGAAYPTCLAAVTGGNGGEPP